MMMELPWMIQAYINQVPVDTPSYVEADKYDYEWQSNPMRSPRLSEEALTSSQSRRSSPQATSLAVTMSLVANAPIPQADDEYVQVSRDVLNAILDEAEHLAQFKEGGQEFQESLILHQRFIKTQWRPIAGWPRAGYSRPTCAAQYRRKTRRSQGLRWKELNRNDKFSGHTRSWRHTPHCSRTPHQIRLMDGGAG